MNIKINNIDSDFIFNDEFIKKNKPVLKDIKVSDVSFNKDFTQLIITLDIETVCFYE